VSPIQDSVSTQKLLADRPLVAYSTSSNPLVNVPLSRPVPLPDGYPSSASSLVFIDAGVADYQTLAANVQPGAEVHIVTAGDAIAQITQVLLQHTGISSIHIVSHGSAGELELGDRWVTVNDLTNHASQLKAWTGALTAGADILLYGCDVARGATGSQFVQTLAHLTGADVAASIDPTGSSALGGNWNLEVQTGAIQAPQAFSLEFEATYRALLAAPVITLPGSAIPYTENTAPILIDGLATLTDADQPASFNGGSLTVSLSNGAIASDRLGIRNQGIAAGQIGLDGRIVLYSGTPIGFYNGGFGSDSLVINFTSTSATQAAVQALLQNLTYSNVGRDLPVTGSRTLSLVMNDGAGGISTPTSKTVTVTGVNDAPFIGNTTVLYDGSTNLAPDQAGAAIGGPWFAYRDTSLLGGTATVGVGNGGTLLTTDALVDAGYSNYRFTQNSGVPITFTPTAINPTTFPILDRNAGYVLSFTAQLNAESRTNTADKNHDGRDDRAGFSVIVLSSDRKGIELGFWTNRIWAQEDGTSQQNPSLEPDTAPASDYRTLFTQAEYNSNVNTAALTRYDLVVQGNTYTLFGNGVSLLTGRLRDYTAFVPPTVLAGGLVPVQAPDPYALPNFVFFGDNTSSAQAQVKINAIAISTNAPLPARTVNQNTPISFPIGLIEDVDSGSNPLAVNLSTPNGRVSVNAAVAGSLGAGNITGNGTGSVTLAGTLAQINATLSSPTALTYQGNPTYFGIDTLTLTVNDGAGGVTSRAIAVTVNPVQVNTAPSLDISGNPQITTRLGVTNPTGAAIADLIARLGGTRITDPDLGALRGIAVTAADNSQGTWQFTTNGGASWTNLGTPSDNSARLLADDGKTRLRLLGAGVGIVPSALAFRAWDRTSGSNGGTADATANGGSTAFSTNVETATAIVFASSSNRSDFDGDGYADLFWRNPLTQQTGIWQMNSFSYVAYYGLPNVTPDWSVASITDFNRDGTPDILWRNTVTGQNAIWQMNGFSLSSAYFLPQVPDLNWTIASTADFNNDGTPDILWRNSTTGQNVIWQMNSFSFASARFLPSVSDTNWKIVSTADFNGDTTPDILWQNRATGQNIIWQMNQFSYSTYTFLPTVSDANWTIATVADFDGDGSADILWHNRATGQVVTWQINRFTYSRFYSIGNSGDPAWTIAGWADLNNDGSVDLLWRNNTSGQTAIWQLNQFAFSTGRFLPSVSLGWNLYTR
jgi:hypothetical protein